MGWFGKKQPEQTSPLNSDRYKGKPLLILLENYVLDCIGCLSKEKAETIVGIVQRVYGGGEDWKATLRATLHLGDGIDGTVREMWSRNQEIARQNKQTLPPVEFAQMLVDQNFAALIEGK